MTIKRKSILKQRNRVKKYFTKLEQEALYKLKSAVEKLYHGTEIKLFGSKVTGKFDEESDLDILIILSGEINEKIRKQILDIVFDINIEFDTNISPLILSKKEWEKLSPLPIHYFIEKEGIPL